MADETPITLAARVLCDAVTGPRSGDLPAHLVPPNAEAAYAVQDAVRGDVPIAGWKLGALPSAKPMACAALSDALRLGDTVPDHIRAPEVEVEIAIRIAADLPPRPEPYARDEVLAALGTAHAAFEIVESRFAERTGASPMSALADCLSSGGFAIGSGTPDWQGLDFTALDVTLSGDAPIAEVRGNASVDQTIDALTWLANHASVRGCGLQAGQFVITGARIGPIVVDKQPLTARIERIGDVHITL